MALVGIINVLMMCIDIWQGLKPIKSGILASTDFKFVVGTSFLCASSYVTRTDFRSFEVEYAAYLKRSL